MRYDLTRLGWQEFEEMSQALAIAVLGAAVSVFGAGPDGGREATFEGEMRYPEPVPPEGRWNGYGVLQAKFKRAPTRTTDDTDWFLREVNKELKTWSDPESSRVKRGRMPQYLVLTTNVVLSPDSGRGGIDQVAKLITRHVEHGLPLRGWAVWHYDQICRFLDVHDGVRRTYDGFTAVGDVLAETQRALARLAAHEIPSRDFSELLTGQAAKDLIAQQWVRLGQAGHPTNRKLQLSEVAVDLPGSVQASDGTAESDVSGVVAHVVRSGDAIRRPRPNAQLLPHVAIVGGPGQGKTTLGQLLCQVYRVALLADRPPHTLGPEIPDLLAQYRQHLDKLGIPTPRCRRWPVRIPLNEFADALVERRVTSLLEYAARQAGEVVPINKLMLREWLREWPWLLVLDGLDEVADPETRDQTLDAISGFLIDAAQVEADLLVVATTRPQGYRDEFAPKYYQHVTLQVMDPERSLDYAEHLVRIQYAQDPEMSSRVLQRLATAATEPITARLMRTPLQVTIMTLLLERRARAPQDRYGLFEAYYTTLYEREIAKNTPISRLLDEQRRNIDRIHERVGLLLQIRAEHAGEAEAHLPEDELHALAYNRLLQEEYRSEDAERLARQLVHAATDRLVMLVGYPNGTIGFEVRSLQELMAARALFTAGDQDLLNVLTELAPSAHWRNTWLFAASRVFAHREHLRDALVLLFTELDGHTPLTRHILPGARLALDLLEEDITANQPRYTRLLVQHALHLLATYPGETMTRLATAVHEAATTEPTVIRLAMHALGARIDNHGRDAVTALDALAAWAQLPGTASTAAKSRVDHIKRRVPAPLESAIEQLTISGGRTVWLPYHKTIDIPGPEPLFARIRPRDRTPSQRIAHILSAPGSPGATMGTLADLADPSLQEDVVQLVSELEPELWPQAAAVHNGLNHWHTRQPIRSQTLIGLAGQEHRIPG